MPKSVYGREEIKETMENEKRKLTIDVIIPVYKPGEKFQIGRASCRERVSHHRGKILERRVGEKAAEFSASPY